MKYTPATRAAAVMAQLVSVRGCSARKNILTLTQFAYESIGQSIRRQISAADWGVSQRDHLEKEK